MWWKRAELLLLMVPDLQGEAGCAQTHSGFPGPCCTVKLLGAGWFFADLEFISDS